MKKIRTGLIGCGNISETYLKNLTTYFEAVEVIAVADLSKENARKRALQFNIPHVCDTNEELLAMEEIEIVLILTNPKDHLKLCMEALEVGKNVYVEKPLALHRSEGRKLVEQARQRGLLLGCAPDTILGSGIQTCRRLIDQGWIGKPYGAMCHMLYHGPECWHPNPAFLYHEGAGVLFDVGPYFVTALSYLLGPVESVVASCRITYPERMITSQPRYGEMINVEVPTFVGGLVNLRSGALATLALTFDVRYTRQENHFFEIYGTEGTLVVPSPCSFHGDIFFKNKQAKNWASIPSLSCYIWDARGIGVADMAGALINKRAHRMTGDMAYHALDVMEGFYDSYREEKLWRMTSSFERSAPMSMDLKPGQTDS